MGMLNRQSWEQRKLARDNRDALRELELAESDRQDAIRERERRALDQETPAGGRAASNPQAPARVLVEGREVRSGQPVAKLPTRPEKGEKTNVVEVESTKVMPEQGSGDLDRMLAKLPTPKNKNTEVGGPSL